MSCNHDSVFTILGVVISRLAVCHFVSASGDAVCKILPPEYLAQFPYDPIKHTDITELSLLTGVMG